jgi:hypothetical protein
VLTQPTRISYIGTTPGIDNGRVCDHNLDAIRSNERLAGYDAGREDGYRAGRVDADMELYQQGRLAGHGDLARELVDILAAEAYEPEAGLTQIITGLLETRETFTRSQVAYLIALAFESGSRTAHREDLAEIVVDSPWAEDPRVTYERAVARRRAEAEAAYHESKKQPTQLTYLADCPWPPVAVPGAPAQDLGAAA